MKNKNAIPENEKKLQAKPYDLERRTFDFAKNVRVFAKQIPKTLANIEDTKQVIRSSGSVGANYIEANESLSKKDFLMRIKICRKEAKESHYWLRLIDAGADETLEKLRLALVQEAAELTSILGLFYGKVNKWKWKIRISKSEIGNKFKMMKSNSTTMFQTRGFEFTVLDFPSLKVSWF